MIPLPISKCAQACVFALLFVVVTFVGPTKALAEDVSVWVYHDFPPFVVDKSAGAGLSFALADMLTQTAEGQFRFEVEVLPRPRLNQRLWAGERGIVLWVNPAWFGDIDQSRYLWSDAVLFDRNVVVSPRNTVFQYDGPRSLIGHPFVGIRGHSYTGVDPLVISGQVTRKNLSTEEALMRFIASGRGQVAIIADTAARYFVKALALEDSVHFSKQAHSRYERKVLVHPELTAVYDFLREALPKVTRTKEWQVRATAYGLRTDQLR